MAAHVRRWALAIALALMLPLLPLHVVPFAGIASAQTNVGGATAITFVTNEGIFDNTSIWIMGTDGSSPRPFIEGGCHHAWSPDGTMIAYEPGCPCPDAGQLTTADRNGNVLHGLGVFPGCSSNIAWSPDGTKIAFEADDEVEIVGVNPDGSAVPNSVKQLFGIQEAGCFFEIVGVTWKDNATVGFSNDNPDPNCNDSLGSGTANAGFFTISVNGGTPTKVSVSPLLNLPAPFYPLYSPDHQHIAYEDQDPNTFANEIFLDGAHFQVSPLGDQDDQLGDWSPDSKLIVFSTQSGKIVYTTLPGVLLSGTPTVVSQNVNPAWINQIPEFVPGIEPRVSVADQSVPRPAPNQGSILDKVSVTLSTSALVPVTVDFNTTDGTATSSGPHPDYSPASGTLTFQPGDTTEQIPITVFSSTASGDKTFTVTLSNPSGAKIGNATATITITHSTIVSIADLKLNRPPPSQGQAQDQIPVAISAAPKNAAVKVNYSATDITATSTGNPKDYTLKSGTLSFPVGGTANQNIPVTIFSSTTAGEAVTFSVTLQLVLPSEGVLGQSTATITSEPSALVVNDNADAPLSVDTSLGICDTGLGTNGNDCTLRAAIQLLDASSGQFSAITFALPAADNHVITIGSGLSGTPLPAITQPVTIDGSTQRGAAPEVAASGNVCLNAAPPHACAGLDIRAPNVVIRGLAVYGFRDPDIRINAGANNAVIQGDAIGTNFSGVSSSSGIGVEVDSASNTAIGGSAAGQGNIIGQARAGLLSSHGGTAVYLSGAGGATIQGNSIGVLPGRNTLLPDDTAGIWLDGSSNTTIGGTGQNAGNTILASGDGIRVTGTGSELQVVGNQVGPGGSGHALGELDDNSGNGISVSGTSGAEIHDNTVTGSGGSGIVIAGSASLADVEGNLVGTDASSNSGLGNGKDGILVMAGATAITIGGAATGSSCAGPCNVIGGNKGAGVHVEGGDSVHILGNYIGVGRDGTSKLPNNIGVLLEQSATGNEVGAPEEGNIIDFNTVTGVQIGSVSGSDPGTRHNSVQSNSIYLNGTSQGGGVPANGIQIGNGANEEVVPPIIKLVLSAGQRVIPTVVLREPTQGSYVIQIFATTGGTAKGCQVGGQGQTLLGSETVAKNGISALTKLNPELIGEKSITATVTDGDHNTSTFSNCLGTR